MADQYRLFAGETLRLELREFIPESFTGPALIEFDDGTSFSAVVPAGAGRVHYGTPESMEDSTRVVPSPARVPVRQGAILMILMTDFHYGVG